MQRPESRHRNPITTTALIIAISLVTATSQHAHANAIMGTYAQNNLMVADDSTVYTAWVFADNTGLNGDLTWGTQHDFFLPPYASLIPGELGVAYGIPEPSRDFFSGDPMIFETISAPGAVTGRLVNQADQVANDSGDLQFYKFTINTNAPIGTGNFDLGPNSALNDPTSTPQPFTKQNIPFTITALAGDIGNDGFIGIDDLNAVLSNWNTSAPFPDYPTGDTNGDRFVGIDDLNWVLGNWNTGTPPTTHAVPEPATISLLLFMGMAMLHSKGR